MAVLVPFMAIGALGRFGFLAHDHGDRGRHVHTFAACSGEYSAQDQTADHCHEHDHDADVVSNLADCGFDGGSHCDGVPDCEQFSNEVHRHLSARGVDLSKMFGSVEAVILTVALAWPVDHTRDDIAPRAEECTGPPRDRCALTAGDRLVRTSRALLI